MIKASRAFGSSASLMWSEGRAAIGRLLAVLFGAGFSSVGDPISYLICIMHCCVPLSRCRFSKPASQQATQLASKKPYYYREAASKRHSQATPKGGRAAVAAVLSLSLSLPLSLPLGSKTEARRIVQACKRIWHEQQAWKTSLRLDGVSLRNILCI